MTSMRRNSRCWKSGMVLLLLAGLTSCRQYMADQPLYKPYRESGFFPDGTSARPLPEGTIPQGFERIEPSANIPFPVTMDVLQRGRERFEIFAHPVTTISEPDKRWPHA